MDQEAHSDGSVLKSLSNHQLNGNDFKQRTMDVSVAEEFMFKKFMLSERLLKTLEKLNFIKPSPVQLKILPLCRCTFDMIIQAKSGTGKTLGFSICLLENYDGGLKFPSILVVVPTRELAVQIVHVLNDLGRSIPNFKAESFIGGTDLAKDRAKIQSTIAVVGTPGRILHLIKNDVFNISNLKTIVLDESDKLLESGQMAKDVTGILKMTRNKVQIIAATATVSSHMENVLKQFMRNPIGITPKHEIPVLLGVKQFVHVLKKEADNIKLMKAKIEELQKVFDRITFKQCLLFTDSQNKTESYGNYLNAVGWKNEVINGAQEQSRRLDVLDKLIKFKCRILITTDLMARGIDIENINLIINLDLPHDCFTYLHRIGRAGRYGSYGIAITFVHGDDELEKFQRMVGDVGERGEQSLNIMRYPPDSISYDFWDFQNEGNLNSILEPMNGETDDEKTVMNDTIVNNLALLNITRKLIDDQDQAKEKNEFNLDALLEDYEQTITKVAEKTLLTNDSKEGPEKQEEHREVIFKRSNVEVIDDETSPENSSSDSDNSEYESEDESEDISTQNQPKRNESQAQELGYNPYGEYVSSNYSQWENIYHFQLANIQNYLQMSKK